MIARSPLIINVISQLYNYSNIKLYTHSCTHLLATDRPVIDEPVTTKPETTIEVPVPTTTSAIGKPALHPLPHHAGLFGQ